MRRLVRLETSTLERDDPLTQRVMSLRVRFDDDADQEDLEVAERLAANSIPIVTGPPSKFVKDWLTLFTKNLLEHSYIAVASAYFDGQSTARRITIESSSTISEFLESVSQQATIADEQPYPLSIWFLQNSSATHALSTVRNAEAQPVNWWSVLSSGGAVELTALDDEVSIHCALTAFEFVQRQVRRLLLASGVDLVNN